MLSLYRKFKNTNPYIFYGFVFFLTFWLVYATFHTLNNFFPELLKLYLDFMGASTQWVLWYLVALKIEAHQIFSGSGIWYKNNLIVVINESCSGINLYIIFTTLVFAFIKGWGRKLLVSVIGIIYLLLLNDFRAIISVWVKIKSPTYYYFTHEVLFLYLLYGFLVYYWYINFKKHGIKLKTNNE